MKKRIITVLIAILTVIPLVLVSPKAATGATLNGSGTSNYGSYTYQFSVILEQTEVSFGAGADNIGFSIPLATGSTFSLHYQFKDTYTGYVQFTLKSNTNIPYRLDQCYWGVNGGYFNSSYMPSLTTVSNSKQFRIFVYNATEFTFTIISDNVNTFHPNSTQYTGFGVSSFGYGLTDVGDVPDIASDIDLYLPGMSTSLSNIDSDLDNINQNIQVLSPYIDQLEGYVDGLEGLLSAINTNTSNLSALSIPIYSYSAYYYALKYGTFYNNYSTWAGSSVGVPTIILNRYTTPSYDGNYSVVIPAGVTYHFIYVCSGNPVFDYYQENVGLINANNLYYDYISGWRMYDLIYTNDTDNPVSMSVCMSRNAAASVVPLYFGSRVPEEIGVTYDIDFNNKYTRLLQSINNGIGALSDDYDTSTYDNYEQTLDGLNDGLRSRFDNADDNMQTNIDTLFTPSGTAGSDGSIFEKFHFNAVNSFMSGFINRIFTTFPAFKYILIFGLLLLVIGVMI